MALTKTTWSMIDDSVFNVTDYGAVGDGIVNDRDAIIAAIAAAKVNGGGTIVFPLGTYIVDGTEQVVAIPELNGSLVYATADYDVQIYIQNANNLNFVFEGAVLKSTKTDSGFTLLLDGCSNITFTNLRMIGATVMSGTTATTTGTNAIGLISLTVDSRNISFFNTRIQDHYGSVDIAGNPASIYSVSNVTFSGSTYLSLGYYGIACRGNGNNVSVENLYSYRQNRGFFIYDTQQISITGTIDFLPLSGFQCLVKCYTTNTRNIKLNCVYKNKSNLVTSRLEFQSQHNPTLQPTPAYLSDIYVEYNEVNCGSSGIGILFSYYQNNTPQASTTDFIFNNFTFVGNSNNLLQTDVTISSPSNICVMNLDNFYDFENDVGFVGNGILNNTGFVGSKRFSYLPTLMFGGNSVGMTYTLQSADYYVSGGICTVVGKITLSAKGSSTGNAAIVLPFYTREDTGNNPIALAIGRSNMSSLTSAIVSSITASSGNEMQLLQQGATGISSLTQANFTNTSEIDFQAVYPI